MVVSVLIGAGVALSACERDDRVAQTIREARDSLILIDGGGAGPGWATGEERLGRYGAVKASLRGVAGRADGATAASVNLLIARATAGEAGVAAMRSRDVAGRVMSESVRVRGIVDAWAAEQRLIKSSSGFDDRAALAAIDAEDERLAQQEAALLEQQRLMNSQRADVEALIDQLTEQGTQVRTEESQQRTAGLSAPADIRMQFVTEANKLRRQAEGIELRIAEAELAMGAMDRELDQIDRAIQTMRNLRGVQAQARERVRTTVAELSASRSESEARARELSREIAEGLESIRGLYSGELTESFESARSGYAEAISEAGRARGVLREGAAAATGSYQHDLGNMLSAQATLAERVRSLIEEAPGSMPGASDMRSWAGQTLAGQAEELASAAAEAYASASTSLGGVRVQGPLSDSLERLIESLQPADQQAGSSTPAGDGSDGGDNGDDAPSAQPEQIQRGFGG